MSEPKTVAAVVAKHGPATERKLRPAAASFGVPWPPPRIVFVAYKEEKRMDLWAFSPRRHGKIASYRILAASGTLGPKRRIGDRQVPEGFYPLTGLNPRSRFHLSIRIGYPNADDKTRAKVPAESLGGDIYIHGNKVSAGCLAMGDRTIEELFTLVATVGLANSHIIITPRDLLLKPSPVTDEDTMDAVYQRIRTVLHQFQVPDYVGPGPRTSVPKRR